LVVKGRYDSMALAQAINYAAATDTNSGLVFAVRGIFGGYQGYFSLLPYHRKIGEYADLDQRDLWEYDLSLDADELRWLLLHVWEMRNIGSDYWFFDENCSFRLLFLLDVARPSLGLRQRWTAWAIPIDTVRWIQATGVALEGRHRPSRRTRVRAELAALDDRGRSQVESLTEGTAAPASMEGPGAERVLEAAADLLQTRLSKGDVGLEDYQQRLVAITGRRAQLPTQEALPVPAPMPPHTGHPSARLELGAGQDHGRPFARLRVRPAFHDLSDPPEGYDPGTRIDFAQVEVRAYDHGVVALHRLDAVAIASIAPRDHVGWKPSYQIGTGLVREPKPEDSEVWRRRAWLDGGTGLAIGNLRWQGALLAGFSARVGQESALGLGPSLVLVGSPMDRLRLVGEVDVQPGVLGERVGHGRAGLTVAWSLDRAWSLVAQAERRRTWGVDAGEWSGGIRWYW
jgi:hypothetical protein